MKCKNTHLRSTKLLKLCVMHNNSSSIRITTKIAPALARARTYSLGLDEPSRDRPDDLKSTVARLNRHKIHKCYLYQISYFPVKGNLWDYECFFSNKIMQKSAARLFMLLCTYSLLIFSRTNCPAVALSAPSAAAISRPH